MNPRNAILFFMILSTAIGGALAISLFGKNPGSASLPPPPLDNYTPPQNDSGESAGLGDFLSRLFKMPSFEISPPYIPPVETSPDITPSGSGVYPNNQATPQLNANESKLKGKIFFGYRNTPANSYDYTYSTAPAPHPEQEYLTIRSSSEVKEKVRITGLNLKSRVTSNSATIGTAAHLPFLGSVNASQDIYIGPNEQVVVVTGRSPLGTSFRINKCTGYFSQFQTYYPSLPIECPAISKEPLPPPPNNINDSCLDRIDYSPTCKTFMQGDIALTPECNNFLTKTTTYSYCVDNHKSDPDFYKNEWRVYLGRNDYLWKNRRETIELLDQEGKIIDTMTY